MSASGRTVHYQAWHDEFRGALIERRESRGLSIEGDLVGRDHFVNSHGRTDTVRVRSVIKRDHLAFRSSPTRAGSFVVMSSLSGVHGSSFLGLNTVVSD